MPSEETYDIVVKQQTDLGEYFRETVHTMGTAVKVGRVLIAAGNRFYIAIGQLAHYVEKGKAGRGLKGGIREFSRGIGISERTIRGYMKATATPELRERSRNLGASKVELIEYAPEPEKIHEQVDDIIDERGVAPSVSEIKGIIRMQSEESALAQKMKRIGEYEKAHGHKLPAEMFRNLGTANVRIIYDPLKGFEGMPRFDLLKVKGYDHGAMPPALALQMLWIWLAPGGLVLDPMAGRGILSTVCSMYRPYEAGRWRCLSYDLSPKSYNNHPDISPYPKNMPKGIWDGLPPEAAQCNPGLVFLDPPYFRMREKHLTNSTYRDIHHYWEFQNRIIDVAANTVVVGGVVAFLIMDHMGRDEKGRRYGIGKSLIGETYRALVDHPNLEYDNHIDCPIPPGNRVRAHEKVRTDQSLVSCSRILWIARRVA